MENKLKSNKKMNIEYEESPEHNKMQGNFLDDDFCLKFYQLAFPTEIGKKSTSYEKKINKQNIKVFLENPIDEVYLHVKNFEKNGIDVSYCYEVEYEKINDAFYTETNATYYNTKELEISYITEEIKIEIVPIVSDNYPSILGKMQKLKSNCLYLKEYTGQGIDEIKFVQMFNQQGIEIVFQKQLDN